MGANISDIKSLTSNLDRGSLLMLQFYIEHDQWRRYSRAFGEKAELGT